MKNYKKVFELGVGGGGREGLRSWEGRRNQEDRVVKNMNGLEGPEGRAVLRGAAVGSKMWLNRENVDSDTGLLRFMLYMCS